MRFKITGGRLFCAAAGLNGRVGDLFIAGGRLVPELPEVDEVLEAHGQAVLAGGVELRAPLAGFGEHLLNLRGESLPPRQVGELYARLGYTHVHAPCLTLATAAAVHRQLAALAVVDASASLVVNLRDLDLALPDPSRREEVAETLCHLRTRTRALTLSVAEPFVCYRQEYYAHRTLPGPRALEILAALAPHLGGRLILEASPELLSWPLPEPGCFHLTGLSRALAGEREAKAASGLIRAGVSVDLGLAMPGPGSLPVWVEMGWFAPRCLNARPSPEQVARALTVALDFPRAGVAFSTLGPLSRLERDYPRICAWLGESGRRPREGGVAEDARSWSLLDFAYATRLLPAEILGLPDRGRLTPGARADVALYDLPEDNAGAWPGGLTRCRTLLKAGRVIIRDYVLVDPEPPRHTVCRASPAAETPLSRELGRSFSFRPENLWRAAETGGPWAEVGEHA